MFRAEFVEFSATSPLWSHPISTHKLILSKTGIEDSSGLNRQIAPEHDGISETSGNPDNQSIEAMLVRRARVGPQR
ncbi:hypothetical protein Y032_0312g2176 [Ancylostoma ceylanicum]|uniref:Uncharacterized protein n=1 Tax=Ancylostoma ceylanicum TaxID=53326 RepID=A0A016S2W3_9BILA|nr:hypothetical protein Y032_0312g2176 [Ancylostoma ceylanicum]